VEDSFITSGQPSQRRIESPAVVRGRRVADWAKQVMAVASSFLTFPLRYPYGTWVAVIVHHQGHDAKVDWERCGPGASRGLRV